jgi:acylpyruvate hydrolase
MQLATIRVSGGTRAVRIDGGRAVETGHSDVGALLAVADWRDQAAGGGGEQHPASSLDLAPVVPRPGKVVCVGLSYRNHILEMGRELPEYPRQRTGKPSSPYHAGLAVPHHPAAAG